MTTSFDLSACADENYARDTQVFLVGLGASLVLVAAAITLSEIDTLQHGSASDQFTAESGLVVGYLVLGYMAGLTLYGGLVLRARQAETLEVSNDGVRLTSRDGKARTFRWDRTGVVLRLDDGRQAAHPFYQLLGAWMPNTFLPEEAFSSILAESRKRNLVISTREVKAGPRVVLRYEIQNPN